MVVHFASHTSCREHILGHRGRSPVPRFSDVARLVHVVQVAQQREAVMVAEAEGKGTGKPSVLSTHGTLHIGDVAPLVLLFQVNVHHKLLRIHVVAQCLALVRLLVIDLDVLYGVVRQILHQHLLIPPHKRARAEQQLVHLAPVHEDFARFVQRHTRHLPYQCIKHRAVGQFERRGIINDGVATIEHFYASGFHYHFVQVQFPHLAHLYRRHFHLCLFANAHPPPHVVVALLPGMNEHGVCVRLHLRRIHGQKRFVVTYVDGHL